MDNENFRYEFSCNPICGKSVDVIINDLEKIVQMLRNGKVTGIYPIWDVVDTLKVDTRDTKMENTIKDTSSEQEVVNKPLYDNNDVLISGRTDESDDFDGPWDVSNT